jgi:hypothetical protein
MTLLDLLYGYVTIRKNLKMNKCEKVFWKRSVINLKRVQKSYEELTNTSFQDIDKLVLENIVFSPRSHMGYIRPLYYVDGMPSGCWSCSICNSDIKP